MGITCKYRYSKASTSLLGCSEVIASKKQTQFPEAITEDDKRKLEINRRQPNGRSSRKAAAAARKTEKRNERMEIYLEKHSERQRALSDSDCRQRLSVRRASGCRRRPDRHPAKGGGAPVGIWRDRPCRTCQTQLFPERSGLRSLYAAVRGGLSRAGGRPLCDSGSDQELPVLRQHG